MDTNHNHTARVRAALATLREMAPGYYDSMFAQRAELSGQAAGSIYPGATVAELQERIAAAEWEPYEHPSITSGARAFQTRLPGLVGICDLAALPPETLVTLTDPKGTGFVEATVPGRRGAECDFTVIIVGADEGRELVFTFFPGSPVPPSRVQAEGRAGTSISAREALALGLVYGKIVS